MKKENLKEKNICKDCGKDYVGTGERCHECVKARSKWLDRLQKQIGEDIKFELASRDYNSEIVYSNLNVNTDDRGISVWIYENKYDYKEINLKFPLDNTSAESYVESIEWALENEKYHLHKASFEEIFFIEMIERYEADEMSVFMGELHAKYSQNTIYVDCIDKISIDFNTGKAEIVETDGETWIVDFVNQSITEKSVYDAEAIIMEEFNEYLDSLNIIDRNVLESQIAELNSHCKTKYYFIDKRECICGYDSIEDEKRIVGGLECIKDFGLTQDYMFIKFDNETINLMFEF